VDALVEGGALLVTIATGLGAGVALAADGLLGLVPVGVAARKAEAENGHHGQLVGLGLSAGVSGAGQNGSGGSGSEVHDGR
jgi:hypothetical protein